MQCPQCQAQIPIDAIFCNECGSRLETVCPSCGEGNRLGSNFCKKCGQTMAQSDAAAPVTSSKFGALPQEVAYNSVLIDRRRVLHGRTAQAIEGLYRDGLEEHYSDLAHHYSRSGNVEKAVDYLKLAGQQAAQRSANAEAVSYLSTALDLLKTFPDIPERTQQELTLQSPWVYR